MRGILSTIVLLIVVFQLFVANSNAATSPPSRKPTFKPTTISPSAIPTRGPTILPTASPTVVPTISPTTSVPTAVPTAKPTTAVKPTGGKPKGRTDVTGAVIGVLIAVGFIALGIKIVYFTPVNKTDRAGMEMI